MLVLGAKARALLRGNTHVQFDDITALAAPVLRHRLLLSYKAEAEGWTIEKFIERLLNELPPK
jgi:MoxR-like ATPase